MEEAGGEGVGTKDGTPNIQHRTLKSELFAPGNDGIFLTQRARRTQRKTTCEDGGSRMEKLV
jgi:hypothetical protein